MNSTINQPEESELIIEHAKNLVRCMRNTNSPAMLIFDTNSVTYPFLELEKALDNVRLNKTITPNYQTVLQAAKKDPLI